MSRSGDSSDVLVVGGRIRPSSMGEPVQALLVRDGRVAALGTESEIRAAARPGAREEDLRGATATPGLTDAHVHLTAWALARRRVDLHGVRSIEEAVERVRAVEAGGDWILGQGWNRHRLGGVPDRAALDAVAPRRPVLLESNDIHAAWLNGEALRRCGITRETPDPPGGAIVRDADGEPTGILLEEARVRALAQVPPAGEAEIVEALEAAQAELHRWGITAVHSVEGTGLRDFGWLERRNRLRLRVLQAVLLPDLAEAIGAGLRSGASPPGGSEWIRVGGVKMFLDGALGSCTAWLREPYEGDPGNVGIRTLETEVFRASVARAAEAGLASTVHAIGDAAVALALEVLGEIAPPAALPHRIEHLQLCPPELWDRAARAGIVASMQPVHLLTDIPAAERSWGHARSRGAYAFAPLLRAGTVLAFGSDVPVETADPRPGLYAAVRRVTWEGPWEGAEWYREHALTPAEALAAYTEGPARAAGEADRRGRLLPGFDADLVAWDVDPLAVEPEELLEMRCVLTMIGGEVVHRDGGA